LVKGHVKESGALESMAGDKQDTLLKQFMFMSLVPAYFLPVALRFKHPHNLITTFFTLT
jgi:hypothetical protein